MTEQGRSTHGGGGADEEAGRDTDKDPVRTDDGGRAMPGTVSFGPFQSVSRGTLSELCLAVLDRFERGAILLASDGLIIDANTPARERLAAAELLASRAGRLVFNDSMLNLELERVLRDRKHDSARARSFALYGKRSDGQPPLRVLVSPLPESEAHNVAFLAFLFAGPGEGTEISQDLLKEMYGLSAAEAEVAARLYEGHSVDDIAGLLELSPNTIRTHVKHVFAKCNVRKQSELLQLLALGPRRY
jgi:DNA-binding CsgD family transcriptional regulator